MIRRAAPLFWRDVGDLPAEFAPQQAAVAESEAAGAEQVELRGGTPGHLLRLEGGDELVALVHVGRPPMANQLEQAAECAVAVGVAAEQEADPVAARLDLRARARPALRPGERLREPLRAR